MKALTSALQNERESGFELYVFEVAQTALEGAAARMKRVGNFDIFAEEMASFYLQPRRPSAREVLDVRVESTSTKGLRKVTLVIKRGHWVIADFVKEHRGHELWAAVENDEYRMVCIKCDKLLAIPVVSIP